MARPKKLNICGKIYKVLYFKQMRDVDEDQEDMLWGQCNYRKREIRIYSGADRITMFEALLHEMFHAMLRENLLILAMLGDANEEPFINDLASTLADCLMRNNLVRGDVFE